MPLSSSTWIVTCMQMMQIQYKKHSFFFLDEKRGHEISFMQFPQNYDNITKNDSYACTLSVIGNVGNLRL